MRNDIVQKSIRSLSDLAAQAPQLYKVVGELGQQRRRQRAGNAARQAGFLGAGLLVGAGLTTLLTPSTGADVRRRLSGQFDRVRDYFSPRSDGATGRSARSKKKELS